MVSALARTWYIKRPSGAWFRIAPLANARVHIASTRIYNDWTAKASQETSIHAVHRREFGTRGVVAKSQAPAVPSWRRSDLRSLHARRIGPIRKRQTGLKSWKLPGFGFRLPSVQGRRVSK